MVVLFLDKAEVQHPGSHGGHPWLNERGEWDYGPRPKGRKKATEKPGPTRRMAQGVNRVLPKPKNHDEIAASISALDAQDKQRDDKSLPSTPEEYRSELMQRLGEDAKSTRKVTPAPTLAMEWAHDGGKGVAKMYEGLTPAVRDEALDGMQHVERNYKLAKEHALTPRAVLLHFVWSILAKSSEPYTQESAYIDLEHSGINYFIDKAIAGKFDPEEYKQWLGTDDANVLVTDALKRGYLQRPAGDPKKFKGLAEGSPGRQVTMNVNIIGKMLDSWSKLGTKGLTDLYTNPDVTGARARREFWRRGYQAGTGINNKILSFATAMLGKPDVMVMDIWQARRYHPQAFKELQDKYRGTDSTTARDGAMGKATVAVAKTYNDPQGLASYEAIEKLLGEAIKGFPVDKNGKIAGKVTPSVFALHWLSWVSNFDAAVGHHSMDTIQELNEEGLSSRGQQRTDKTPTADDKLSELGQTHVGQGNKKVRTFGSKYQRGTVPPDELKYHASFVPTEFVPGSFPSPFGDWLKGQPSDVRAEYSTKASQRLEPVFRTLAKNRGLALSVNEGYGGFGGHGNANTQATLVPLDDKMSEEDTQKAVRGFAADLGWAFKQDMAVYGHMVPKGTANSLSGYDFQLNRQVTPEEAERLGAAAKEVMAEGLSGELADDSDAGYSFLPNNRVRFINFTGFSKVPLSDEEFRDRVARAVSKAVPDILDKAPDGAIEPYTFGWEGDAISNDWDKDAEGHGYDQARNTGAGVQPTGSGKAGPDVALQLRQSLDSFNEAFQAQHQGQQVSKSLLLFLGKAEEAGTPPAKAPVHVPEMSQWVHNHAVNYVRQNRIAADIKPHGYAKAVPEEGSKKIADAFDRMKHNPANPKVHEAYHHLAREVGKQYDYAVKKMGMKFEPWHGEGEPYKNSAEMIHDVTHNHHMHFFTGGETNNTPGHPLAAKDPHTGLSVNDKFRAVHDLFGHAHGGYEFGPRGEENAWIEHRKMFSDKAIPALTTETRGQNHWVNAGAHLRRPDGTLPKKGEPGFIHPSERPFAKQKVGLLPKQFHSRPDIPERPAWKPRKQAPQVGEVGKSMGTALLLLEKSEDEERTPPHPWKMTKEQFSHPPEIKPTKPGYRLLYHVTKDEKSAHSIMQHGLDNTKANANNDRPNATWATTTPDDFSKTGHLITFQVPKDDKDVESAGVKQVNVMRKVHREDVLHHDAPYDNSNSPATQRLSEYRHNYPEEYHRAFVEDAIKAGRHVPDHVLKDYPDLKNKVTKSHDVSGEPRDKEGKWTDNPAQPHKDFMAGKRGIDRSAPYWTYLNLHKGTKKPLVSKKTGMPIKDPKTGKVIMVPDQKIWSLKNVKTGLVDAHVGTVYLKDVKMHIGQAGRRRVIVEGRKNVHAGIIGTIADETEAPKEGWQPVHYNPKEHPELANGFFMIADPENPDQRISNAKWARFTPQGTEIIGPTYVKKKHDDDLYPIGKSDTVKKPGSRGGHPWLNDKGEWQYGPHPKAKDVVAAAPVPHENWPTGLPKINLASDTVKDLLRTSHFDMTAEKRDREYGDPDYIIHVLPHMGDNPHIKPVPPRWSKDDPATEWYDDRLAELVPADKFGDIQQYYVKPKKNLPPEFTEDLPEKEEKGYIWRGLSSEEMQEIRHSGKIHSHGEWNIGEVQNGLTYFADDPSMAASYAGNFAPAFAIPSFDHPGYVIKIKTPADKDVVRLPHIPGEVGVRGPIQKEQIAAIYELVPYAVDAGDYTLTSDQRTVNPSYNDGSSTKPGAATLFRKVDVSKFLS